MKNYEVMSKTELIREITSLLEERETEADRAQKSISRLKKKAESLDIDRQDRIEKEMEKKLLEERFLLHENIMAVMEEMVGNIAHQWRQPLNIVGLTVQKLQFDFERNEVNEDYMTEMVNEVLDVVKQMSRTVQTFRDFMQTDRKKQQFNLGDSLRSVLSFVEGSMKSAGVSIKLDEDEDDLTVDCYRNEFCRIMLNMLNNSRKALLMNKVENPMIAIHLFRKGNRCVISIRDNGGCIREIDRIFDPQPAACSRGTGSSMGLHMSKAIIERKMNGKLTAGNRRDGVEIRVELKSDTHG